MDVEIHADKIVLRPYGKHEEDAIARIVCRTVTIKPADAWDSNNKAVYIEVPKDDWGT